MSKIDDKLTALLQEHVGPDWSYRKGLKYDPDYAQYFLNKDGLRLSGEFPAVNANYKLSLNDSPSLDIASTIANMQLNAALQEGGNYGLNASMPLGGGTLGFGMNRDNDINRYLLQYNARW